MKKVLWCVLIFPLLVALVHAEDWTLPSGRAYKDVVVRKVTKTTVSISHQSGVATLELQDLGPSILKSLGVDPEAIQDEVEARAMAEVKQREIRALWKNAERVDGSVVDVKKDGIVVESVTPKLSHGGWNLTRLSELKSTKDSRKLISSQEGRERGYPRMVEDGSYFIPLEDITGIYDGMIFDADVVADGTIRIDSVVYRKLRVLRRHIAPDER